MQKLQETIDLQKAQKHAQSDQTRQVRELLNQASTELEVLRMEKKRILQQWNSSLVGMQRRDEALAGIQKVKQENQDNLNTMQTEMSSYKRSIKQAQEKNELLTGFCEFVLFCKYRIRNELQWGSRNRKSHFARNLLVKGELTIRGTELTLNARFGTEINF